VPDSETSSSGSTEPAIDVLVIGAGFAGLAAACKLLDAGSNVMVLEARATGLVAGPSPLQGMEYATI
jgi:phytoene dehydrogenase-like protein